MIQIVLCKIVIQGGGSTPPPHFSKEKIIMLYSREDIVRELIESLDGMSNVELAELHDRYFESRAKYKGLDVFEFENVSENE